jgi:superoxide dismutase, Fe-Mn family
VFAWEHFGRQLIVQQLYDHDANLSISTTPLLVFDCWEHAYYLWYRNVRPDYLDALRSLVN